MAWTIWYCPRFIIALGLANENLQSAYAAAGPVDYLILLVAIVAAAMGIRSADATLGEGHITTAFDRVSLFLTRVTMVLVMALVGVMFYEVVLRYVFEAPTLWANELSLWLAGFIFLISGLYAMQQRTHIRIFLIHDLLPRWLQKTCDVISTALIVAFNIAIIWGAYNEALAKFLRWETFGTAFDPPLPATIKPMILIIITLVSIQAVFNLFADWRKPFEPHGAVDAAEIEDLINTTKKSDRNA